MGLFNFFIVLPQTIYSLGMPFVIKYAFHGDPVKTITLGGACLVIAALLALKVKEITPACATAPVVKINDEQTSLTQSIES
jgi:maltose/moltooligosaccharide transporter